MKIKEGDSKLAARLMLLITGEKIKEAGSPTGQQLLDQDFALSRSHGVLRKNTLKSLNWEYPIEATCYSFAAIHNQSQLNYAASLIYLWQDRP